MNTPSSCSHLSFKQLELLFVAAEITGNQTYIDIANAHATTTMKNHIRDDGMILFKSRTPSGLMYTVTGSTWHVIEYSASTGKATSKHTAQGYSDSSTWARGQAWGIYGFANSMKLLPFQCQT